MSELEMTLPLAPSQAHRHRTSLNRARQEMRRKVAPVAVCLFLGSLSVLCPLSVRADSTTSTIQTKPVETKAYVDQAAAGDRFEIDSSKLALEKSKNEDIRAFAQMMIRDHTASSAKLQALLKKEKMDEAPTGLDQNHQAQFDQISSQSNDEFDSSYVKAQVSGHEAALALHKSYAATGTDKGLKAFAAATAKIVAVHLEHVKLLAKKLNVAP